MASHIACIQGYTSNVRLHSRRWKNGCKHKQRGSPTHAWVSEDTASTCQRGGWGGGERVEAPLKLFLAFCEYATGEIDSSFETHLRTHRSKRGTDKPQPRPATSPPSGSQRGRQTPQPQELQGERDGMMGRTA